MTDKTRRFFVPEQASEVVTEIKRSRFIATIEHCPDTDRAYQIIDRAKARHPDARHHCWAFIACAPFSANAIRCSDDGEPSGTAGKPILNVLQYSGYGEIICVVSRYFGGIKLGAGGLVRAYSNSTQAALELLSVKQIIELVHIEIQFSYPFESSLRHYIETNNINLSHINYHEQVIMQLELEQDQLEKLLHYGQNLCKGQLILNDKPLSEGKL